MNSMTEATILEAALALLPEHRAVYLDQSCAGDAQLRERVEALLQAHDRAGRFMVEPAAVAAGQTIRLPMTEKPGDKIGHYKLLQQIGEGGCGVVYMAEQEEPIRHRVAFKVIKLGMDTRQVIARFEAERQALALMDHPNIAKVLDAGATETGRPYFVMELVRGIKITDYCDQNNLTTEQRLDLFMQVCHAIQHAHQKGIIHRDIKPSNILVTMDDGVPVPKVIDFGIAKATGGQMLTDKTLFTAFEQFIGTPAYMSPEQAEMTSLDIDTRSDSYALGVLFYELLTGKTPFDAKELIQAGLEGMRRIIREKEPARPSTKISTLGAEEQTRIATRRQVEAPKLIHQVRGDLDWIVMKCLEKDRTRRYETANGLAADLQRHLNNEPVVARPPSQMYRLQKLVRRNKLAFAAATAVVAALVLGLGFATWSSIREYKMRQRAEVAEKKATDEAARADRKAAVEKAQRQRAEDAATGAKMALSTSDFLQACRFVAEDKDHDAVAYLVASLRANPANDAAVTRLATLLTCRTWLRRTLNLKHAEMVSSAQFSPDGKRVLTVSTNVARVWDAQTGQPLTEPLKHAGVVVSAQFSPDGKRVVTASGDNTARVWDVAPPPAGYPAWLLQLATATCGEVLDAQGVLEYTNPVQAIDRLRQTLSEQPGNDDWLTLGRWLLADPSARTISPFSRITVPEWIERRFQENMTNSLAELAQWAISTGDAVFLERVSQARPAAESAEAASASARALEAQRKEASHRQDEASRRQARFLNALAWLSAASPREDLRDGRIAVVLAEKAAAATSRKDPAILGTLAAGLAEAGRFAEAVLVQREALGLLNDAWRKEHYSSRLKLYESKSPYRDAQAMDFPEILTIGKLYESSAPYRDAAANGLAPAAYDRLGMAALWARGTLCAQFAQWTLAASDLTKAIALNPDENLNWFLLAPLLLETGDTGGYRKHCHAMLARFGTTDDPPIAQRTAKVCLLLPLDGADLAAASKLAETAVTLGKDNPPAAYCQFAKGLAEYRQANFAQAVEWTQKALSQPGTDYNRDIQAYSVLSMALHRLNRAGEAHEALSKASELAGAKLPRLDSGDLGPNWHNWIIAQTLLREAKVLMEGAAQGKDKTQ